jgi:hypothetical protein
MIRIYLTDFVDIVGRNGGPKVTKVKQLKDRPDYEPAFDFYKPLRERIIEVHTKGKSKQAMEKVMVEITDKKKIENYPTLIKGYKKWWGNRDLIWFEPVRGAYKAHDVEVIINPELGLEFEGTRHLIKLYFKADRLSAAKAGLTAHLMELSLRPSCKGGEKMGILDVRNAKLTLFGAKSALKPMIDAELAYVANLWSSI